MARRPRSADDAPAYDRPSKTQLKREMQELQDLGTALIELPEAQFAAIDMPEDLREAFTDYLRFPSMEAKRRQMQYIGKMLRTADMEPLHRALEENRRNRTRDIETLHSAEQWRDRILAGDDGWQAWVQAFPNGDTRPLRGLVANARRELEQAAHVAHQRGEPPRKGKLYRELFQKLREVMLAGSGGDDAGP